MVKESPLSAKQTLKELAINGSTFYKWYQLYEQGGYDALRTDYQPPKQFWNEIPPWEKERIVKIALDHPEKSPPQACPSELEAQISLFVDYYNNRCYNESLKNVTPADADVYDGHD